MKIPDIYDFSRFYRSARGGNVRAIVQKHIAAFLQSESGGTTLASGYPLPFIDSGRYPAREDAGAVYTMLFDTFGLTRWPDRGQNRLFSANSAELPLPANSVERIVAVHALEFAADPDIMLEEYWRVLKSTGRLLLIVPNRTGLWARAERTPFGQGVPYSSRQLEALLTRNLFIHEKNHQALFTPPYRKAVPANILGGVEKVGSILIPGMGGVHIVEATKRLYIGTGKAVPEKGHRKLIPTRIPTYGKPATSRFR